VATDIDLLICIDGTHANLVFAMSDDDYDKDFKQGHVRRVFDRSVFGSDYSIYIRGPKGFGSDISSKYTAALNFITKAAQKNPKSKITLHFCGHSRGGAIVLDLANELCRLGSASGMATTYLEMSNAEVGVALRTAKSSLAGRSEVSTLTLFDAVDMSTTIEGKPISGAIGHVAHAFRSPLWGSRNNWGNVGLELEKGSSRPNFLREFNCTHAAMGGTPCTGDIPKPMVHRLLGLKSPPLDWARAEMQFRHCPANAAVMKNVAGQPGLFVNPDTGVMIDLVSKTAIGTVDAKGRPAYKAVMVTHQKAIVSKPTTRPGAGVKQIEMLLKQTMTKYAMDSGTPWHDWHNITLGGFQNLARCFATQKEASQIVNNYRVCDEVGSREAYKWVSQTLGYRFPAKL
jgi:hypothetical protein